MIVTDILNQIMRRTGTYRSVANPFSTSDELVNELVTILNHSLLELVSEISFTELWKEASFNTNVNDTIYPFIDIADDIQTISVNTVMDFGRRLPMIPVTDEVFMKAKMYGTTSIGYYKIANKAFEFLPTQPATTIKFGYYSNKPVIDINGNYKEKFEYPTDSSIINGKLLILDVAKTWLKDKGLETHVELESEYNNLIDKLKADSQTAPRIRLDGKVSSSTETNLTDGFWSIL